MDKKIYTIKDCIEYVHDAGKIGEMDYADLLNELDELYDDSRAYQAMLYDDEDEDDD